MFDRICIKNTETRGYKLDAGFLLDTMLFYGKVVLLVHKEELSILIKLFGENLIRELIITGRLDLRYRENILGTMIFPGGKYSIDTFSLKDHSLDSELYQAHRMVVNNSSKNQKFANDFSKIIESFTYPQAVRENIISDFNNKRLLGTALPIYLKSIVPDFNAPEKIEIEIIKDGNFGPFDAYSLNTNIDLKELNRIHKKANPEVEYDIDYGGFLLSIAESKGDIVIASELDSEIVTSDLYSKFIEIELEELIKQRAKSEQELTLFNEYVLKDCTSIGFAFLNGIISGKELLHILDKADKFRDWLKKIPEDKSLLGEYHNAIISKNLSDKLPTKVARFILFEGIGITLDLLATGGIATAAATALSLA
ncbi:MAG: hypothetical protein EOP00_29790, partial [Pedobacter sp.]